MATTRVPPIHQRGKAFQQRTKYDGEPAPDEKKDAVGKPFTRMVVVTVLVGRSAAVDALARFIDNHDDMSLVDIKED